MTTIEREQLHEAIDSLSESSLDDLKDYLAYLKFKEERKSDWFSRAYDLFAPVREVVAASGMTSDEVNQLIDEAIEEVRRGD